MLIRVMIISLIGLLLIPLTLSVMLVLKTITDYKESEMILGEVVSCVSRELKTGTPPRVYINHYKKVETEEGNIVIGSYGYSREDSCNENIGREVKVLKNNKKERVYSFRDFFMMPLIIFTFSIVLYGVVFIKVTKYRKLSKIKKPT
tara:strand:+ start:7310 stop:7750 length:441 start_codon:yes stop_codon:yes gene_type:complete